MDSTRSPRVTSTSTGGAALRRGGMTVGLLPAATLPGWLAVAWRTGRLLALAVALAEDAAA